MTRSSQAIVMRNALMESTNSRTKNKRILRPLPSVTDLDALETVNTSTGETAQDDELPEDLWPNLNAMLKRLQQLYTGNHEEKLTAREHGFDRDFWAGSPGDCTTKFYRLHVKPRSTMFDPRQCATSPIPAGVEIVCSNTTSTMTGTCGQVLLKGPSG